MEGGRAGREGGGGGECGRGGGMRGSLEAVCIFEPHCLPQRKRA